MAPGRAREEEKEQQWRRRISQWRTSGLSVRAYCARPGLTTASFYNWRRVLERRAAEEPAFVQVQVVADAVPAQARALEVRPKRGMTVRGHQSDRQNVQSRIRKAHAAGTFYNATLAG